MHAVVIGNADAGGGGGGGGGSPPPVPASVVLNPNSDLSSGSFSVQITVAGDNVTKFKRRLFDGNSWSGWTTVNALTQTYNFSGSQQTHDVEMQLNVDALNSAGTVLADYYSGSYTIAGTDQGGH